MAIYAMAFCPDNITQLNHLALGRRGIDKFYSQLDVAGLAIGKNEMAKNPFLSRLSLRAGECSNE